MRAYIIDFTEPVQVAEAYHDFLKQKGFILRTADELELSDRVRLRFNLPDGHGVTLLVRVVSILPEQGYGVQLPDSDDTSWLVEKAEEISTRLSRTRKKKRTGKKSKKRTKKAPKQEAAEKVASSEDADEANITRRIEDVPTSLPVVEPKPVEESDAGEVAAESGLDEDAELIIPDETKPASDPLEMAEKLAPSQEELLLRVSRLDDWVAEQMVRSGAATTIPVAPQVETGPVLDKRKKKDEAAKSAPTTEKKPDDPAEPEAPPEPESPEQQLWNLPTNKKKKLAISGNEEQRRILMQDEEKDIHLWVLKNPEVTEEEVVVYSEMSTISAEALTFLLQNRKWATTPGIVLNLTLNPLTPPEAIPNLLTVLPNDVLKKLVAMDNVRHLVARQARRILMERTDQ